MTNAPRTMVYVDGFNLYYGSTKDTPYKWLDIKALAEICYTPSAGDIVGVKYFTAKSNNSRTDNQIRNRQATYLKALRHHIPGFIIQYGHYITDKRVRGRPTNPNASTRIVEIFTNEEKGSDVNLAVAMVSDAFRNNFDTAILISNDGDLRAPIAVTKQLGKTVVALIPWRRGRRVSRPIMETADDYFLIERKHLAVAQMPNPVVGKGQIYKPAVG